jgi:hypothetical protein
MKTASGYHIIDESESLRGALVPSFVPSHETEFAGGFFSRMTNYHCKPFPLRPEHQWRVGSMREGLLVPASPSQGSRNCISTNTFELSPSIRWTRITQTFSTIKVYPDELSRTVLRSTIADRDATRLERTGETRVRCQTHKDRVEPLF